MKMEQNRTATAMPNDEYKPCVMALMYSVRSGPCPDGDALWDNFPEEKRAAVLELMVKHGLPIPETVQYHHPSIT
jgi:hypothetical protein